MGLNDDLVVANSREGRSDVGGTPEPVDRDNLIHTEIQNTFNDNRKFSWYESSWIKIMEKKSLSEDYSVTT